MKLVFAEHAWEDYLYWQKTDRKMVERINTLIKDNWMDEARKFAERQGREVRKLIQSDLHRVRSFVEREKRDLEKLQKQIPGELNRWKKALEGQKKELTQLLNKAGPRGAAKAKASGKKKVASRTGGTKPRSTQPRKKAAKSDSGSSV
jgi:dsDNA-specific endonuclease/ATPase MutS2